MKNSLKIALREGTFQKASFVFRMQEHSKGRGTTQAQYNEIQKHYQ